MIDRKTAGHSNPKATVSGYFCVDNDTLGQFTRNYTQTTKRGLLTTNKG